LRVLLFEDEAAAGADDSSIEGGEKSSPVVVEHVELVMTDDESIYADAEEILCSWIILFLLLL
jgi:hypothetical protein